MQYPFGISRFMRSFASLCSSWTRQAQPCKPWHKFVAGVNNVTDLEYISSRHPAGARAGKPLTAWIKAVATFN